RIWLKPRSQIFWEETCQDWEEKDWNENFHMSKEAFNRLCRELSPHISKRDTNYRKAITVPPLILGDSAYALSNWLMKPYIDRGNLTPEERSFNIKHSTTRV
ncbi:unnamed protein product, partial [Pocillopora meandrina]